MSVGDLDQDGTRDRRAGAPRADGAGRVAGGVVFMLRGGSAAFQGPSLDLGVAPLPVTVWTIAGPEQHAELGTALAVVTSGTAVAANLWIGAPGASDGRGLAILLLGSTALGHNVDLGDPGQRALALLGGAASDRLGSALAAGSLETQNTIGDLVVVAPRAMTGSDQVGALYGVLDQARQ